MEFETNPLTGREEPVDGGKPKRKRGRPRKSGVKVDNSIPAWVGETFIPPEHVTDEVVFPPPEPDPIAAGPYTVWYWDDRALSGARWWWRDFDSLQEAIDWPHKGSRYVITKPVKYEVREVAESNIVPFVPRKAKSEDPAEELSGPSDPDNPDSGPARYV